MRWATGQRLAMALRPFWARWLTVTFATLVVVWVAAWWVMADLRVVANATAITLLWRALVGLLTPER